MKINCKQIIARLFSPFNMIVVLLAVVIFLFSSSKSYAPSRMSDAELSDIEGQAIFSVNWYSGSSNIPFGPHSYTTGSADVVRLWLGIDAEMNAHMGSFKMGYYGGGWDQDTTNYFWGTTNTLTPLRWSGVFVDFGFDNYTSTASRILNYIEIGTMSASGEVAGSINTINGLVQSGTGTNSGVMLRQTASQRRLIYFNNEVMSFVFCTKYNYSAAGGATANLSGIFIKIPEYDSETDLSRP
jgi:hypothetical protein